MYQSLRKLRTTIKLWLDERGQRYVSSKLPELQMLPFFDNLFVGKKNHSYKKWKNKSRTLFCHGSLTITVSRNDRLAGMFSFDKIGPIIMVRQIQTARRSHFFDDETSPQVYLYDCMEKICFALGAKAVIVETSDRILSELRSWGNGSLEGVDPQVICRMYDHAKARGYKEGYFLPLDRVVQFKT